MPVIIVELLQIHHHHTVSVCESSDWYWYDCFNEYQGTAKPCDKRWSCCNAAQNVTKCSGIYAREIWTCCEGGRFSEGCTKIMKSQKIYLCCSKPDGSDGCELIWTCCKNFGDNKGCVVKYPCCNKDEKGTGCTRKCANCKILWSEGPGCVEAH